MGRPFARLLGFEAAVLQFLAPENAAELVAV